MIGCWVFQGRNRPTFAWPPNVLILEANASRENPSGPKGLNKNLFFKEPIKTDGYYFKPSGKSGLGTNTMRNRCKPETAGMNRQPSPPERKPKTKPEPASRLPFKFLAAVASDLVVIGGRFDHQSGFPQSREKLIAIRLSEVQTLIHILFDQVTVDDCKTKITFRLQLALAPRRDLFSVQPHRWRKQCSNLLWIQSHDVAIEDFFLSCNDDLILFDRNDLSISL